MEMNKKEIEMVLNAFCEILSNEFSNSSCNDLFEDQYPKEICKKFKTDHELLSVWKNEIRKLLK